VFIVNFYFLCTVFFVIGLVGLCCKPQPLVIIIIIIIIIDCASLTLKTEDEIRSRVKKAGWKMQDQMSAGVIPVMIFSYSYSL